MAGTKLPPGIFYLHGNMPNARVSVRVERIIQRHWIVPSRCTKIVSTVDAVEKELLELPLDPQRLSDFILAISELIQNAFLHAPENCELHVEVSMVYLPGVGVYVGVSDQLGPMDPGAFEQDISDVDVMAEHGRGIPLMRAFSSLLVYSQNGEWKEIILGLSAA